MTLNDLIWKKRQEVTVEIDGVPVTIRPLTGEQLIESRKAGDRAGFAMVQMAVIAPDGNPAFTSVEAVADLPSSVLQPLLRAVMSVADLNVEAAAKK